MLRGRPRRCRADAALLPGSPAGRDLLLDGLAVLITEGYAAGGADAEAGAARLPRDEPCPSEEELRWLWLACRIAADLGTTRAGTCCPSPGRSSPARPARSACFPSRSSRAGVHSVRRRAAAAAALVEEAEARAEATGSQLAPYGALLLAAWRGREAETSS